MVGRQSPFNIFKIYNNRNNEALTMVGAGGSGHEEYKQNCRKKVANILHNQNNDSERGAGDSV